MGGWAGHQNHSRGRKVPGTGYVRADPEGAGEIIALDRSIGLAFQLAGMAVAVPSRLACRGLVQAREME